MGDLGKEMGHDEFADTHTHTCAFMYRCKYFITLLFQTHCYTNTFASVL